MSWQTATTLASLSSAHMGRRILRLDKITRIETQAAWQSGNSTPLPKNATRMTATFSAPQHAAQLHHSPLRAYPSQYSSRILCTSRSARRERLYQQVQAATGLSRAVQQSHRAPYVPVKPEPEPEPEPVFVVFRWPSALALPSEVAVTGTTQNSCCRVWRSRGPNPDAPFRAGTFCHWDKPHSLQQAHTVSDFFLCLPVRPGLHQVWHVGRMSIFTGLVHQCLRRPWGVQYKFKVDGVWQTSPILPVAQDRRVRIGAIPHSQLRTVLFSAAGAELTCSLQGLLNNEQLIAPTAIFSWPGNGGTRSVSVTGSFTGWSVSCPWTSLDGLMYRLAPVPTGPVSCNPLTYVDAGSYPAQEGQHFWRVPGLLQPASTALVDADAVALHAMHWAGFSCVCLSAAAAAKTKEIGMAMLGLCIQAGCHRRLEIMTFTIWWMVRGAPLQTWPWSGTSMAR